MPVYGQSWWTARDVPGKAVWTDISENEADLFLTADFNSNSTFYLKEDSLTQCFKQPPGFAEKIYAHTDSEYWNHYSFRINDAERIPGRGSFRAGITSCEKRFGNDWLVLMVVEPWVKEPNYCSDIKYTSRENVLEINHCLTDDLPEPLPRLLTVDVPKAVQPVQGEKRNASHTLDGAVSDATRLLQNKTNRT